MKNMNMKERYWTINLQLFAGDGGDDDPGDEGGDDDNDDPGDDDDDSDDDDQEENEKKFSQKDVDDAVKKRLAREKRKWQKDQQKKAGKKPNGKVKTGEDSNKDDDVETQELRDKAAKADEMKMNWTCFHSMRAASKLPQRQTVRSSRWRSAAPLISGKTIFQELRKPTLSWNMANQST